MEKNNRQAQGPPSKGRPKGPGLSTLLKPYRGFITLLVLLALISNAFNLWLPKIIAATIDSFTNHPEAGIRRPLVIEFLWAVIGSFVFAYLQSIVQTYTSEKVARDLRTRLSEKISRQSFEFLQQTTSSKLLTNLTADVDSIKSFVSQAIVSIASSLVVIIGASILMLGINWKLGLIVIAIIPIIGITFFVVLKKVRALFLKSREVIDTLNKVINESILGAAIIRVINSMQLEYNKFMEANKKALGIGLGILRLFASLIPVIVFTSNLATLAILALGGHYVIGGSMSLGDLVAFNNYLAMLVFPILIIGFMSNVIAQASASYTRISSVLNAPDPVETGTIKKQLEGTIAVKNVTLSYKEKNVLKDISFTVPAGSRTAIIGPTAAGKTQLLQLLTALTRPNSGAIEFDGHPIAEYEKETFHKQIGFVFQDSIIAQAVNTVTAMGVTYFSSAGNDGSLTYGTSSTWEGDFLSGGAAGGVLAGAGLLHNFGGGTPQNYNVLTSPGLAIDVRWSDPLGGSSNDYDLYILNAAGTAIIAVSAATQDGTQDPVEEAYIGSNFPAGSRIVVALFSGAPRALHVNSFIGGSLSINTTGATVGHNAAANTVTLAASYWNGAKNGTKPFTGGAANPTEPFSSDGPRKIFFTPNGTAITPGNFLFATNGGTTLVKPDLAASNGGSGLTPGFNPFFGTSASAPHAAAIAALILQAKPSYTVAQIKAAMTTSALDTMAAGVDRDSGYGMAMALGAVQYALTH